MKYACFDEKLRVASVILCKFFSITCLLNSENRMPPKRASTLSQTFSSGVAARDEGRCGCDDDDVDDDMFCTKILRWVMHVRA